jgi:hypothetical protein
MTRWFLAAVPLSVLAASLVACSQQADQRTAAPTPPSDQTLDQPQEPQTSAEADDPDATAKSEGYASAAERARAQLYDAEASTEVRTSSAERTERKPGEVTRR